MKSGKGVLYRQSNAADSSSFTCFSHPRMPPPHSLGEAEGLQRPRARDLEERRCTRSSERQEHLCDASRSGEASRGTKPRSWPYLSLSFSHRLAKPGKHQATACYASCSD